MEGIVLALLAGVGVIALGGKSSAQEVPPIIDTTPPSPPVLLPPGTGVTLTDIPAPTGLMRSGSRLSWNPVVGATGYKLMVHKSGTPYEPCSSMEFCNDLAGTSRDFSFEPGIYDWWVHAVRGGVVSEPAGSSFTVAVAPPIGTLGGTADVQGTQSARQLLGYLKGLPLRSTKKIVLGQRGSVAETSQNIFNMTGQWPGIIEEMYFGFNPPGTNRIATVNPIMLNAGRLGAIVTVMSSVPHPDGGGLTAPLTVARPADIFTENGNATNQRYRASLDLVAEGLRAFQNENIPVILRMFPECNANWFWWGTTSISDTNFKAMWRYTFDYLTKRKGIHNVLWLYNIVQGFNFLGRYPGAAYVDITSLDLYDYNGGVVSGYAPLVGLGHPFALAELGLQAADYKPGTTGVKYPEDINRAIQSIKTNMPKTTYIIMWNGGHSLDHQTNASLAANDPAIQMRPVPYR